MLNKRLYELRKVLGLSQDEISAQLGIKYRAYISYERGERKIPIEILKTLIEELNVNCNWLITGNGSMFQENIDYKIHLTEFIENVLRKHNLI